MNKNTQTKPQHSSNSERQKTRQRVRWVAKTGILTAIAAVLMYLEFSVPLVPVFLKMDFSNVVSLLAAFSMGPLTGVLVELLKNVLHLPATTTGGVGELANFAIGASFVATAGLIYRFRKDRSGAVLGMLAATLTMTVFASLLNYWIMIPFYVSVMDFPIEAILEMTRAAGNRLVVDLRSLILYVFVPFNFLKGLVISLIVLLIYKRVSPLLHR